MANLDLKLNIGEAQELIRHQILDKVREELGDLIPARVEVEIQEPSFPSSLHHDLFKKIEDEIRGKKKIQAIRTLREATGMSLLPAKKIVELMTEFCNNTNPDYFPLFDD